MTINEDILLQYLNGTLTEDERIKVERWRNESPDNEKIVEQIYFTLQMTERIKVMKAVDTEKAFIKFQKKIQRQKEKVSLKGLWLGFQKIAAMLFIPLLVLAGYLYRQNGDERLQMVEISTNPGVVSTFDLPDGSKVWLNSESSLKYVADFKANKRMVELKGEGYFEVVKDMNKPFIVNAGPDLSIEVLGTSFNVFAYEEENVIETTLVEGLVKLNMFNENGNIQSYELKPNEKAEFSKKDVKLEIITVNPEYDTGWMKREIIFRQSPMSKVLKVLSRHYNVDFEVEDPGVMNAVITARFKDEQLPQVMEYLEVASGIKYTLAKPLVNEHDTIEKAIVKISK